MIGKYKIVDLTVYVGEPPCYSDVSTLRRNEYENLQGALEAAKSWVELGPFEKVAVVKVESLVKIVKTRTVEVEQ